MSFWVGLLGCYLATVLSVNIGEYHSAFTDSQGLLFEPEIDGFPFFPGSMCHDSVCLPT